MVLALAAAEVCAALRDYDVDGLVKRVGLDVVDHLAVERHAYLDGFAPGEESVVESFATPHAVAVRVICHGGNHHQLHVGDVGDVIAGRLLDVEGSEPEPRAVVGEKIKVDAVDSRQEKFLPVVPSLEKVECREFVGVPAICSGQYRFGGQYQCAPWEFRGL